MEEVEARTRGRDHAEHDPQPRAVVGAERHASLAVAEMRDAMRVDAHRLRSPHRCDRVDMAAPPCAGATPNGYHPVAGGSVTQDGHPDEIFVADTSISTRGGKE